MRIKRLSLLIAIAINLLGVQHVNAEQHINTNNQLAPVWTNEQVPIAWADCIPVPVMPLPQAMMNNPMGAMGNLPFDSAFIPPVPYVDPNAGLLPVAPNQAMIPLPPPGPFFTPAEITPTPQPTKKQAACNNEDSIKLNKLQSHYNHAAAASKAKIAELEQALDDIQNQMADSRGIINQLESKLSSQPASQEVNTIDQSKFKILQSAYQLQTSTNNELKKKLSELENAKQELAKKLAIFNKKEPAFKELQTANQHQNIVIYELKKNLEKIQKTRKNQQAQLAKLKASAGMQSEKLGILSQTTTKFKVLQQAYQQCTNEISQLEKSLDSSNTTLKSQTQKLTELQQTAAKFKVLQQAYQKSSNEITTLRNRLIESKRQIAKLKDNSSNQTPKLSALGQTTTKFKVLQGAYQLQNHEVVELKKKVVEFDTEKKALQFKLEGLRKERNDLKNQLASLQKIDSEFKTLKGAYELRNNDISKLKKSLAKSESSKQTLLAKLSEFEKNLGSKTEKLSALAQESNKFIALQEAYKLRTSKIAELEKSLTESEASKQTLLAKLSDHEKESNKLKILQESYKLRTNEIAEFEKVLAESEASKQALQAKLKDLEEETNKLKILQESYKLRTNEVTEFENILAESEANKQVLQVRLKNLEKKLGSKTEKLTTLKEESKKFKILQDAYKLRTSEITEFENILAESETSKQALLSKLKSLEDNSGAQAQKLSALGQTATEFKVLQGAYQSQNHEVNQLKKKIVELDTEKKALKLKLEGLKKDRSNLNDQLAILQETDSKYKVLQGAYTKKTEKLTALEEESKKFKILQEAYKLRTSEIAEFKNIIAESENTQKALQSKLKSLEDNSGVQAQKLTALGQTATEFKVLQGAYQLQNHEVNQLKKKIVELDTEKKALKLKLEGLKQDRSNLNDQLAILQETDSKYKVLQGAYAKNTKENTELKKKLASIEDKNKSLKTQLSTLESDATAKAEKIAALGEATTELSDLQKAYKDRLSEISELKNKLATLDNEYKSLQAKLATVESNAANQARKLTALSKSATDLKVLQGVYKERNNENTVLKKKLADMEITYKELQTKLGTLEADAASKSQKLQVLGKAASNLSALQIAFKANFDEKTLLEKQLAEMQNSNKSLQSKLAELESTAANQAEKMAALGKSTTELGELQKAYKAKLQEIADLKTKLAGMDDSYKALQSKLQSVESNASEQEKKLTSLAKSADELIALKSAYKTRNDENAELKRKLAEQIKSCNENTKTCKLEISKLQESLAANTDKNKSLLAKLTTFEKTSSDQARQITSLMATASELKPLKSAYEELNAKLAAATADSDNDGVLDQKDKCPNSPAGTEVDLSGCLADSDKDGIADSKDQCPTSPEGSTVNSIGCPPIKDADGDGIADKSDLCPNSKAGETVNTFGCTPSASINLKGVNFATGSATLTANSLPILNRAAETLVNNPTIKVEIAGHTDSQGLAAINKRLSQRRANTVMNYLIKKGVSAKRLSAKGYGETQPIANNKTTEGRATNRRVEMKIK